MSFSIDQECRSRAAEKVLSVEDQGSSLSCVADAFLGWQLWAAASSAGEWGQSAEAQPLTHQPPETAKHGPRRQVPWDSISSPHSPPAVQHVSPASPGSRLEMQNLRLRPGPADWESEPSKTPSGVLCRAPWRARPWQCPGPVTPAPGFLPVDALSIRNVRRAGNYREDSVCQAPLRAFYWCELI